MTNNFKCLLCNYETDKQVKLSKHTSFTHKLKFPEYLISIKYNNIHPTCGCGCEGKTKYAPEHGDFYKFIVGHNSRVEGHWGDWNNKDRVESIKKTRKEKFENGDYDHLKEKLSKPRSKEIIEKIKNTKKENPYIPTQEVINQRKETRSGYTHSQETKDKMSKSAINNIIKTDKLHSSKLEDNFFKILEENNIKCKRFFYVKEIKAFYDFKLLEYDVIIEVDGDFWHCNPKTHSTPKYKTQIQNLQKDQIKNKWCIDNNYKLLRFWEYDIKNNLEKVIKKLKQELKIYE